MSAAIACFLVPMEMQSGHDEVQERRRAAGLSIEPRALINNAGGKRGCGKDDHHRSKWIYYRSFRAVVLCGLPVALGTAISLAVAYLAIGHLNSATAFLSAIIVGNGINFMIMLLARFFEEIRLLGPGGLERALRTAVSGTMRGTAIASLAASVAYGALVFAGFRGFREFGIIGGVGMVVCWVATFRSALAVGAVLLAVGIGTLWMIGFAAAFNLKLNFLNFVVIPIILGDGVDYGANIFERYRSEGRGRMADIIRSTGGAVVLESLTANLGYASLILSTNMALQSFGILANIGEFTCLAAAEIVMTAFIVWWERSRRQAPDPVLTAVDDRNDSEEVAVTPPG
jgi:predicted RND superfamily exporter protein